MGAFWENVGSILYDILAIVISIADITTDVMVIFRYYNENRKVFFIISLVILILAQISYCILFLKKYGNGSVCKYVFTFICVIPLAPFMSFIFYWGSRDNNCVSDILELIGLDSDEYYSYNASTKPKLRQYVDEKLDKHGGFILEALFEAFPQSLLQMTYLVYYQETEVINIISILLSLISVSAKSSIFSVALDVKTFIFNWLSLIIDFIGIFMTLSLVFYNPENNGKLTVFGKMWIYKIIISTAPILVFVGGVWSGWLVFEIFWFELSSSRRSSMSCCEVIYRFTSIFILTIILWIIVCLIGGLVLEIGALAYIALVIANCNGNRFQTSNIHTENMWQDIIKFVCNGRGHDKVTRICCANKILFDYELTYSKDNDKKLEIYLKSQESKLYQNVSLNDLKVNSVNKHKIGLIKFFINEIWLDIFNEIKTENEDKHCLIYI